MIELAPPCEIGLPARFSSWRPQQLSAIDQRFSSERRVIAQCLPTGTGKSLSGMAQAIVSGERTLILTSTKGLEDQYVNDFKDSGLVDIRGRNNYDCAGFPHLGLSCDEGRHLKCQYQKTGMCPHHVATSKAINSKIVVSNYTCYILNHLEHDSWGKFDFLILDEAHDSPDTLSSCLSIKVTAWELKHILARKLPDDNPDSWVKVVPDMITALKRMFQNEDKAGNLTETSVKRLLSMKRLQAKLERIAAMCGDGEWVVQVGDDNHTLECLWPAPYAEPYLFHGIPKILLMSATMTPKTATLLGVDDDQLDYQEFNSTFIPTDSPVYVLGCAPRIDHRSSADSIDRWIGYIDTIIASRLGRKGIIHSVSFARARDIALKSKYRQHMIVPEPGTTQRVVERFKSMPPPAILVSPSVTTGYDFPGTDAEYQIITKVPFPDSRSVLTQMRSTADPLYAPYLTVQTLVQSAGRLKRSMEDRCETFIIDSHWNWFYMKYRHLFPIWFRNLVRRVDAVPQPIKRKV